MLKQKILYFKTFSANQDGARSCHQMITFCKIMLLLEEITDEIDV